VTLVYLVKLLTLPNRGRSGYTRRGGKHFPIQTILMKASKTARRERAAERQAARAKRTDEAQLKRLDKINGKNRGAVKERARLTKRIANR
jgi:hypothetical protein